MKKVCTKLVWYESPPLSTESNYKPADVYISDEDYAIVSKYVRFNGTEYLNSVDCKEPEVNNVICKIENYSNDCIAYDVKETILKFINSNTFRKCLYIFVYNNLPFQISICGIIVVCLALIFFAILYSIAINPYCIFLALVSLLGFYLVKAIFADQLLCHAKKYEEYNYDIQVGNKPSVVCDLIWEEPTKCRFLVKISPEHEEIIRFNAYKDELKLIKQAEKMNIRYKDMIGLEDFYFEFIGEAKKHKNINKKILDMSRIVLVQKNNEQ